MSAIVWNRMKHDVKVKLLNEQHQKLFGTLKELYAAMEDKSDKSALLHIINNLSLYVKQHLETEEALLEKYNYPGLEEQREQHRLFVSKIDEFKTEFENNRFMLYFDIAIFLKTWIANHIEETDKKYADFLNSHNVF